MSEENTAETTTEKKTREPKKNSIPMTEVEVLAQGIPSYRKASFLVVGHKGGVRLALPLTAGISRAYFYGNDDYSLVPTHDAITVFTEEQRKERRKGGIMAEVDFEGGLDAAREALAKLIEVVRAAPAPAPRALARPKAPKKEKAVATVKELALDDGSSAVDVGPVVEENDGADLGHADRA